MKRKVLIFVLLLLALAHAFASNQVITSLRAAAIEESEASSLVLLDDSYLSQIGVIQNDIIVDRPSVALGNVDYPVTVGDVYSLTYSYSGSVINLNIQIDHSGIITIPNIGQFSTLNKSFIELKNEVENAVIAYNQYSNPYMSILKTGEFSVYVKGEVTLSTYVQAWGLTRLSDLAFLATKSASTRNVIVRGVDGEKSYDLFKALQEGDESQNPLIKVGDSIEFVKKDRLVSVKGAVNKEGYYQLLDKENLQALLTSYAKGPLPSSLDVTINRYDGSKYSQLKAKLSDDIKLLDGDEVIVNKTKANISSVSIEGALLNNDSSNLISGNASSTYYFRFSNQDTIRDLVEQIAPYFTSASDLAGVSLVRSGVTYSLNFSDILYGNDESGDVYLERGDKFIIPFNQLVVNVIGAVNKSGVYGYVPGKTASYYINLAGGFSSSSKGSNDYVVRDKYGNKITQSVIVPSEATIEVERDNFVQSLQPTLTVLSVVTAVLSIVTAVVNIATK